MTRLDDRLRKCFRLVFPQLAPDDVDHATRESVAGWDSLAMITLVKVLEAEFQIAIDFEALAELDSFDTVRDYVRRETGQRV